MIDAVTARADFVTCCRMTSTRNNLPVKLDFFEDSLLAHATIGVLSEKNPILL